MRVRGCIIKTHALPSELPVDYLIRPICADDADREREFICGLSAASRYSRLMYAVREPSDEFVERMVNVDHHSSMAYRRRGWRRKRATHHRRGAVCRARRAVRALSSQLPSRTNGNRVVSARQSRVGCSTMRANKASITSTRGYWPRTPGCWGWRIGSDSASTRVRTSSACWTHGSNFRHNQDTECKSRSIPTTTSTVTSPRLHQ